MGYFIEINTLVRLPDDFDKSLLNVGKKINIILERERLVPLHIALLLIHKDWNFYGYCRVNFLEIRNKKTNMEVEIISLFNRKEQKLYKENFIKAAKITGEV